MQSQSVTEIHALVSSSKALYTWTTRDAIQEAREACGGHGYLKAANIGELRSNHDPTVTYEGDNNVLGQQASNFLLKQWNESNVESPFGTANFIKRRDVILRITYKDFVNSGFTIGCKFVLSCVSEITYLNLFVAIITCYEWLLCWLLQTTSKQMDAAKSAGVNTFQARNDAQVYRARDLARAFAEYYTLKCFNERIQATDSQLRPVLQRVQMLYGLWSIDRHLTHFYHGNFACGPEFADNIRCTLLDLCKEFKDDAVAIADSIAPPDWVLNSILAKADGKVSGTFPDDFLISKGLKNLNRRRDGYHSRTYLAFSMFLGNF